MLDNKDSFDATGIADQGTPDEREVNWVADPNQAHELANTEQQRRNREEEMREVSELGTEDERNNITIMEGLLEKYPTAMQELILEDGTKVAVLDTSRIDGVSIQEKTSNNITAEIVAFSKKGLSVFCTCNNTDLKPHLVPGMTRVVSEKPDYEYPPAPNTQEETSNGVFYLSESAGNSAEDWILHYPKSFYTQKLNPNLTPESLGKVLREVEDKLQLQQKAEAQKIAPEDLLNQMP